MAWSAALLLSAIGCRPPEVEPPVVVAVDPGFAWSGGDVQVRILGDGFWPEVQLSTTHEKAPDPNVGADFRVSLIGPDGVPDRVELDTTWVDSSELSAVVKSGVAPGSYDVEVVSPRGQSDVGVGLFNVTDIRPDHLLLEAANTVWSVTEQAEVTISLFGEDEVIGQFVFLPLDLSVTLSVLPDATVDWIGAPNVLTEGEAVIKVRADGPMTVTLTVAPAAPTSPIRPDELDLVFEPGEEWRVLIELDKTFGQPPFVAGTEVPFNASLVDEDGHPIVGSLSVALGMHCGSWSGNISLAGGKATPFSVTPDEATSDEVCPEEYVEVLLPGPEGESLRFEVLPAGVDHFQVSASPVLRQAGDLVNIVAEPEDQFGNRTGWSGVLTLTATGGGLQNASCAAIEELQLCTAQVTLASPSVVIEVIGDDGKTGSSNPIVVVADDVPAVLTVTAPGPATAGIPTEVEVRAQDTWGNPMDAALLGSDAFVLGDELGDATCTFSTFLGDGAAEFSCTLTVARTAAVLEVEVPAHGVVGTAAPIVVTNGALAAVAIAVPPSVTAGTLFTASLAGTDTFGNPYIVQADPVVELADDMGTFPVSQVTLGTDGTADAVGALTLAGATVLRASQGGVELGASGAIEVLAGPGASFVLRPAVPWAFVNEPLEIAVETFDAYGNPADWEGDASFTSTTTASPAVVVPLLDGSGTGLFTWTEPSIDELLVAEAEGFSSSLPIIVALDCGASGPAVVLTLDGFGEGITCLDPATDSATITADLSSSVTGAEVLVGYVVGRLGEPGTIGSVPVLSLTVAGAGPHPVGALVIDDGRCGAELFTTAWAGPDDGTPTGPIALTPLAMELLVFDNVSFDVLGVVDCARMPAAFAGIGMRSTAGLLAGLVSTGAGLELALDASGNGAFAVDTNGALEDGISEVHAFVESGAARGLVELPIVGDTVRPIVLDQTPIGPESGSISEIRLTFSEPLSPDTVLPEHFSVTGPFAVNVTSATLEQADTEVVLTLSPAADGAAGPWIVGALTSLLDLGGNQLAGTWGPGTAPYGGMFGDVGQPVDPVVCTAIDPPGLVFRPDGDPGTGVESDEVSVTLDAASAPSWWVLDVKDTSGDRRLHDRIPPLGAQDTIVWDGRGFDGMVVENGAFTITIVPDDGAGNRGSGCTLQILVDNRTGALP